MKLICISCGHTLDLREAYDDYEGKVKCFVCGAMLAIRTCDGQVKAVDLAPRTKRDAPVPYVDLSATSVSAAEASVLPLTQ